MKTSIKYFSIVFLAMTTLLACKPSSNDKKSSQEVTLPVSLETVSVNIEGMTCEIGCAKTIEAKISKMEGVSESKVDFEAKKGTFTYDANKTSEASIVSTINGLLDGKTYTASASKSCCATKEVKACTEACAKKSGHEVGETCEKCKSDKKEACCATDHKKDCDKACAEKCGHKEDESCNHCSEKKEACQSDCEKPCCATKK